MTLKVTDNQYGLLYYRQLGFLFNIKRVYKLAKHGNCVSSLLTDVNNRSRSKLFDVVPG